MPLKGTFAWFVRAAGRGARTLDRAADHAEVPRRGTGRAAEHVVRRRPFGRPVRFRVELHGVSVVGPGDDRVALRWEWIESISVEAGAVVVRGGGREIELPPSAFGVGAEALAAQLEAARRIERRPHVIGELAGGSP